DEDVELVNHSAGANKKAGDNGAEKKDDESAVAGAEKQANGSVPAEGEANELKEKVKHPDNSATLPASVAADQDSELEDELLDANARSMEEDAVAASDKTAAEQINTEEDDEKKIRESMPERKNEGDDSNTTV
ncbi:hypothetical protein KC334_g12135, partial [Hortaea werneckii]